METRGLERGLVALTLIAPLGLDARAQVVNGDVLVGNFDSSSMAVEHYSEDGTLLATATGGGISYEGALLLQSDRLATTARSPNSVRIFDLQGSEVDFFLLPQVSGVPGDLDQLSDGTLVVMDQQGGEVELYSEAGQHRATFTHPNLTHPFGCYVDGEDRTWVADLDAFAGVGGIFCFDKLGNALLATSPGFEPGDLVIDNDGTIWVTNRPQGLVVHLDAQGALIGSFDPLLSSGFEGIGLHENGTLYLGAEGSPELRMYTRTGQFRGSFPVAPSALIVFLTVVGNKQTGTPYCFGSAPGACPCGNPGAQDTGCAHSGGHGAVVRATGSTGLASDELTFSAAQLLPDQPALLFAGTIAPGSGHGVFLGDGLRCAGIGVRRLGIQAANSSGDATWGPGLLTGLNWSAGDLRYFQVWYRDPFNSPCGSAFNLTNGVEIELTP